MATGRDDLAEFPSMPSWIAASYTNMWCLQVKTEKLVKPVMDETFYMIWLRSKWYIKAFSWLLYYISTSYNSTNYLSGLDDTKACNKKNMA
jgi:hypothetical protein